VITEATPGQVLWIRPTRVSVYKEVPTKVFISMIHILGFNALLSQFERHCTTEVFGHLFSLVNGVCIKIRFNIRGRNE
jgi:hypothetical protein